jgi:hypothetical protein
MLGTPMSAYCNRFVKAQEFGFELHAVHPHMHGSGDLKSQPGLSWPTGLTPTLAAGSINHPSTL